MKKILLSFFLLVTLGLFSKAYADPCSITASGLQVTVTKVESINGQCHLTLTLSFTAAVNNGASFAFVHLWQTAPTNLYPGLAYNNAPTAAELQSALATIVIQSPGTSSATLYSVYPQSPSVSVVSLASGATFNRVGDVYTLTNVKVVSQSCGGQSLSLKGDVWVSQDANGKNVGCFSKGTLVTTVAQPTVFGQHFCQVSPGKFNVTINNTNGTTGTSVSYKVYSDINRNGLYEAGTDQLVYTALSPVTVGAGTSISTPATDFDTPPTNPTGALFIVGTATDSPAGTLYSLSLDGIRIDNACAVLPVSFKSFTATRGNTSTSLKWTTATESNNKGFYVQRFYNNQWSSLGFVATKAENGNSSSDLNYTFNDVFTSKGVVQYRIMQVDIDNKAKYSDIRSIDNGNRAGAILIYPNPAAVNGNVSIVVPDAGSLYDIQIVDNSGRVVKEYNSVRNTQQVSGLSKGQYLARVVEKASGQVSVEKFIMQ